MRPLLVVLLVGGCTRDNPDFTLAIDGGSSLHADMSRSSVGGGGSSGGGGGTGGGGNGGIGGGGGGGGGGGQDGGGGSNLGPGDPPNAVECGSSSCDLANSVCCLNSDGTSSCAAQCAQTQTLVGCDGPEDCAANSYCCAIAAGVTCTPGLGGLVPICTTVLCHADADCVNVGNGGAPLVCCPAMTAPYRVCKTAC